MLCQGVDLLQVMWTRYTDNTCDFFQRNSIAGGALCFFKFGVSGSAASACLRFV